MEWKGIFPALTTPFTEKDELDLPMFEKNLDAQVDAGVHGIIIGGSLGEASTLTASEKRRLGPQPPRVTQVESGRRVRGPLLTIAAISM